MTRTTLATIQVVLLVALIAGVLVAGTLGVGQR